MSRNDRDWCRRRPLVVLVALLLAGPACEQEALGTLQVTYVLRAAETGVVQSCAAMGATQVEIALFVAEQDGVPYDRATFPCDAAQGRASVAFSVAAGDYAVVQFRLISSGGQTLRLCSATGEREPALVVRNGLHVPAQGVTELLVEVVGSAGSCEAPSGR